MRTKKYFGLSFWIILLTTVQCKSQSQNKIKVGAERLDHYISMIDDQKVGLLVNHTSTIGKTHLLDTLMSLDIDVVRVFAPEHGFRGNAANGEHIKDGIDINSGLPIVSLYGANKKPQQDQLTDLDIVIFDIQDVGARFYTYISAMHYMMEACADAGIQMMILDRPNPNASYVDGPVLDLKYQSYVGMHPIPIVHGMTCAELAQMILGEGWLNSPQTLDLEIVKMNNWDHQTPYILPIRPSPNLPNAQSVALYPSLCLFEGTNISVGRGTPFPFQVIGIPDSTAGSFSFTPVSIPGVSQYPKHENRVCYGLDLRLTKAGKHLDLSYLIDFYNRSDNKADFFNSFFVKLAGTDQLQKQIEEGMSIDEIRASWEPQLTDFKQKRLQYLLYP